MSIWLAVSIWENQIVRAECFSPFPEGGVYVPRKPESSFLVIFWCEFDPKVAVEFLCHRHGALRWVEVGPGAAGDLLLTHSCDEEEIPNQPFLVIACVKELLCFLLRILSDLLLHVGQGLIPERFPLVTRESHGFGRDLLEGVLQEKRVHVLENVVHRPVAHRFARAEGDLLTAGGDEFQNISSVNLVQQCFGARFLKELNVSAVRKPRLMGLVFLHEGEVLGGRIGNSVALLPIGAFDLYPSCNGS